MLPEVEWSNNGSQLGAICKNSTSTKNNVTSLILCVSFFTTLTVR